MLFTKKKSIAKKTVTKKKSSKKNSNRNMSLKLKVVSLSIISMLLLALATTIYAQYTIRTSNLESMEAELNTISSLLSDQISAGKAKTIIANPSKNNPGITSLQKQMDQILKENPLIHNLYLITLDGEKLTIPTMSSAMMTKELTYGSSYSGGNAFDRAALEAFKENKRTTTEIYESNNGDKMTGFAPITDMAGKTIALYGVDFDVSQVNKKINAEVAGIWILALIILSLSSAAMYFLVSRLIKPLNKIRDITANIAKGDLSQKDITVKTKDEVGALAESINTMAASLRTLVSQVQTSSREVSSETVGLSKVASSSVEAIRELTAANQQAAASTQEQNANIEEMQATLEEINAGIEEINASAQQASYIAKNSTITSKQGTVRIDEMLSGLEAVDENTNQLADIINVLEKQSDKITQFVKIINTISDQTNLLALNAAIEAARAGEHGKGFAVVANEVRKLAEESAKSASTIITIVNENVQNTRNAVDYITKTREAVQYNKDLSLNAKNTLNEIYETTLEIEDNSNNIASAIEQQVIAIEQITNSLDTVSQASQQIAAGTGQADQSTQEQLTVAENVNETTKILQQTALELEKLTGNFKL
ncbi:methyl-accepting chemotaxis protein [Mesobacillus boroniphilus]|uniref:Methyl-accepting chemotaxis protein n=1 Tax=Mesobacillus boroniphilus TaxID=308892 RepID=A0A944CJ45_9BACI|nr:methyl-accepting chemotaxis protein [Mesobacillus boroniphilus]MBS8263176.1 methyl-accepting chemotaxis protein [Mesobacillus boroniphilus]